MKAGDKIKCVGPTIGCRHITIGKIYEVLYMDSFGDPMILNDRDKEDFYMNHRFKVVADNTLQDQIDKAISLIGKTVEHDGDIFIVSDWGIGNRFNDARYITDNLVDGVCVYVESDEYFAPLCKLKVLENTIPLTDNYTAIIEGDNVKVGRQTIPIEKVKQILDTYNQINK